MSQVLILASSSTHDDAYDHHTTHNNRNVKFAMKNLRVRGCFFFFLGGCGGKGGEERFKLSDQKDQLMIMIRKWEQKVLSKISSDSKFK
jgi:hypothetical protein